MKKAGIIALTLLGAAAFVTGCGKKQANIVPEVTDVKVYTQVTPGGQYPDMITVTCKDDSLGQLSAEDYVFNGKATGWMDASEHAFTANIDSIDVKENQIVFNFTSFPEKYFYVTSWEIKHAKDETVIVSSNQVSQVITPVADEFESFDGYHLFTPADTSKPQPIVVVFHGFSDTNNLLTYRTSVAWAEEANQAQRPCYVLSPVINDEAYFNADGRDKVYEMVHDLLMKMVDEGKVDADRIYIMGNSFGGMATVEFSEKYPEVPAACMPLCAAINYSTTAYSNLDKIKDIPIWFAQAENDQTIPSDNSKKMYDYLSKNDAAEVSVTIYSDDEMNAVGGSNDPNSTYSYHHVELAVMEDAAYAEWLFSHTK